MKLIQDFWILTRKLSLNLRQKIMQKINADSVESIKISAFFHPKPVKITKRGNIQHKFISFSSGLQQNKIILVCNCKLGAIHTISLDMFTAWSWIRVCPVQGGPGLGFFRFRVVLSWVSSVQSLSGLRLTLSRVSLSKGGL